MIQPTRDHPPVGQTPGQPAEHWMMTVEWSATANPAAAFGWIFVLCTVAALGYGLWSVHLSGRPLGQFEAGGHHPVSLDFDPLDLDPGMNPLRVNLRAGHAPFGSTRIGYRVSLREAGGAVLWEKNGALGSMSDKASEVWSNLTLGVLEVPRPGRYSLGVAFHSPSQDDLRAATIRVRRNVHRADPRWLWGLAGMAALSLVASILSRRTTRVAPPLSRAA